MVPAIHKAVARGDLKAVQKFAKKNLDILETPMGDYESLAIDKARFIFVGPRSTPLINAAMHGKEDIVDFLLDKGVDVDAEDYRQETALNVASCYNHIGVVKLLLNKGEADVNQVNCLERYVCLIHRIVM